MAHLTPLHFTSHRLRFVPIIGDCGRYPLAGLPLAVLPFLFVWGTHSRYFTFALLLVFGAAIAEASGGLIKQRPSPDPNSTPALHGAQLNE